MKTIEFKGRAIDVDDDGFLIDFNDWSNELAESMAEKAGLNFSEDHWEIIKLTREFYRTYQYSPNIKILVKHVKSVLGSEKGNTGYLYRLFPDYPARTVCLYAGIPPFVS